MPVSACDRQLLRGDRSISPKSNMTQSLKGMERSGLRTIQPLYNPQDNPYIAPMFITTLHPSVLLPLPKDPRNRGGNRREWRDYIGDYSRGYEE